MISRPRGGSYDWVRQTPHSFEITVLDIIFPQVIFVTVLEFFIKRKVQTEF
jgi:hypothetical protein